MEYNVLVMECLQTKDLYSPPPAPPMMCIVSYIYTCTVEPQFDQGNGKICSP